MTKTLAHGYSSDSIQHELSNKYQNYRVYRVFKNLCIIVPWMKVALALEGLTKMFLLFCVGLALGSEDQWIDSLPGLPLCQLTNPQLATSYWSRTGGQDTHHM